MNKNAPFWQTEMLRLTLFTIDTLNYDSMSKMGLLQKITGSIPDAQNAEPKNHRYEESCRINEQLNFVVGIQRDRIDFLLIPIMNTNSVLDVPEIGFFTETIDANIDQVIKWLPNIELKIKRIAYGARLFGKVKDKVDGYKQIAQYLKDVKIDPVHSFELNYTINKPREEKISSLKILINRLSRWAVLSRKLYSINADMIKQNETDNIHACTLDLDINTDQNISEEIDNKLFEIIIYKLHELAFEISEKGDVK